MSGARVADGGLVGRAIPRSEDGPLLRGRGCFVGDLSLPGLVLASGGGFIPFNEARRTLVEYDATLEGMRASVRTMFHDPSFAADDEHVRRRWQSSLEPGAWEVSASARFKSPAVAARGDFG